MKKLITFTLALYLTGIFAYGQKEETLWNAYQTKKISVSAKWTSEDNQVYGRRLQMTVTNLQKEEIKLLILPGETFLSNDPTYQNQMVGKLDSMTLAANAADTLTLNSFCVGHEKQCPGRGDGFVLIQQGDQALLFLADYIFRHGYYNSSTAQAAIWTAQGSTPISSIYGIDSLMAWRLAKEVARITSQPPPVEIPLIEHHIVVLKGNFNYQAVKPVTASLGVYDAAGAVVNSIMQKQLIPAGLHTFTYYANEIAPEGTTYVLKLVSDKGEILYSETLTEKDAASQETYSRRIIYPFTLDKGYKELNLAVYDTQGNPVAEIFGYKAMPMGTYNINYTLHHNRQHDSVFYVRLMTRDKKIVAQKLIRAKGAGDDKYPEETQDIRLKYPVAAKAAQTRCVIYTEYGDEIAVVFQDKKLNAGPNEIKYTLKHTYGKNARFIIQVLSSTGQIIFSKEIVQSGK